MIDKSSIELAFVVLVTVAWVWALSQLRVAIRRGGSWRWTVVLWTTSKAAFFTMAASIWWFNWFDAVVFELALYALAATHIVMFVHWLRLPDRPAPVPPPDVPP